MTAIRDHPKRPTPGQSHVLTQLALRLDWTTGRGYAGTRQLEDDAGTSRSTVQRATRWARDNGFLTCTRRGHRISDEITIASEWLLTIPHQSQPDTADRSAESQGVTGDALADPRRQNGRPKASAETTQGVSREPHLDLSSSKSVFIVPAARAKRAGTTCPRCGRANGTGHEPGCDNEDPQPVDKLLDDLRRELEPRRRPGEQRRWT
jgi:hypothetical protein